MRKLVLYIATSLDGFIAKSDGSVDWLHDPDFAIPNEDYGYKDFYESIDTTLMGFKTYQGILGFDMPFPYQEKKNYVLSRTQRSDDAYVEFVRKNIEEFTQELKEASGKDIWLIGGGEINAIMLNGGLIDDIILTLIPITLGSGIPLFPAHEIVTKYELLKSEAYSSGLCQLTYNRKDS